MIECAYALIKLKRNYTLKVSLTSACISDVQMGRAPGARPRIAPFVTSKIWASLKVDKLNLDYVHQVYLFYHKPMT